MAHHNTSPNAEPKLVQTRLPPPIYKRLLARMKKTGDVSVAAYIRRVLIQHVEETT